MQQIITCHSSEDFTQLLEVNLGKIDIDVIIQQEVENAFSLLEILPTVRIIVVENKDDNIDLVREYKKDSSDHDDLLTLIVGSKLELQSNEFHYEVKDWEQIILKIKDVLDISIEAEKTGDTPAYIPIPLHYLKKINYSCCPIYQKQKGNIYDIIFNASETISQDQVQNLIAAGTKSIFIPLKFREEFATILSNQLIQKLEERMANEPDENKIAILGDTFDILIDEIKSIGFNAATIQLTQSIVSTMLNTIEQLPEAKTWMTKLLNSPTSIQYQTAFMVSIVAQALLKKLKPNTDLSKQHQALTYAAFAHDLPLMDLEDATLITCEKELQASKFSPEDIEKIIQHAHQATKLLDGSSEFPITVKTIVLQHHGSVDGVGYPHPIEEGVTLLSKIFIISEVFVVHLLKYKKEKGKESESIYKKLKSRFTCKDGLLIIKALRSIYSKK